MTGARFVIERVRYVLGIAFRDPVNFVPWLICRLRERGRS